MNQLDKFSVDFEIWWNFNILQKNPDTTLPALLRMFSKGKQDQIDYILFKFNQKKCSCCNGKGFVAGDQPL